MVEGAFTLNARSDCDYTNTLPNHACQITGRRVLGAEGHGVDFNSDTGGTIEDAHGLYVAGIFDAAHDNGYATALYTGKDKFALFDRSWDGTNGAPDITGEDNGRDKIDHYMYLWNTSELVDSFISLLKSSIPGYYFLHLRDPDTDGHAWGWKSTEYFDSVIRMDGYIEMVIGAVENDPVLSASTAVVVTADHGGTGTSHSNASDPSNYTIQFHAWGPGIPAGADIYAMNPAGRLDPGAEQPVCAAPVPPVRNGEAANLAASLLGIPPVTGSTIGIASGLTVTAPVPLPSVVITSPADGAGYGPDGSIEIEVFASSGAGIAKVEFFAGWQKIGEDLSPPWRMTWDELPLGTHEVSARAFDTNGWAETAMVRVEVVSVTSTENGGLSSWDRPRVYPNPAGTSPSLYMNVPAPGPVEITLYDAAGRLTGKQSYRARSKGLQAIRLNVDGYGSGVYFFRAAAGDVAKSGKFILVR
jgi:hypothetical protein